MVSMAGLQHALDDELPKAGDIHLDSARDAKASRSFGCVMNLRQSVLQQRIIHTEDPSLDRESLPVHDSGTCLRSPQRASQKACLDGGNSKLPASHVGRCQIER